MMNREVLLLLFFESYAHGIDLPSNYFNFMSMSHIRLCDEAGVSVSIV